MQESRDVSVMISPCKLLLSLLLLIVILRSSEKQQQQDKNRIKFFPLTIEKEERGKYIYECPGSEYKLFQLKENGF